LLLLLLMLLLLSLKWKNWRKTYFLIEMGFESCEFSNIQILMKFCDWINCLIWDLLYFFLLLYFRNNKDIQFSVLVKY